MPLHAAGRAACAAALLAIVFSLALPARLPAQVVSDPRVAEFDPSPDHWTLLDNGQPAVLRYELGMYMQGAAAPFTTIDMGKPAPDSDGKIRFYFASVVTGLPLPGGDYVARVSAVGSEGQALSSPSNPFSFTAAPSCMTSLAASTLRIPGSGGDYAVAVSTGSGCPWTASTALPWVKVWVTGGTDAGTVPFQVQPNTSLSSRSGTITIGGQPLTLLQAAGVPAPYQLTIVRPSGGTVQSAGVNCGTVGATCQVTMPAAMWLGLQAAADAGYSFSGWTGDCSGTSPSYSLQLNGSKSCGARFAALPAPPPAGTSTSGTPASGGPSVPPPDDSVLPLGGPYTLTIARPSGGVVKAAGLACGTAANACTVTMPGPMTLGLQATPDPGYVFLEWTGNCRGSSSSYLLALEGPRTCGAGFVSAGTAVVEPAPVAPAAGASLVMGAPYTLTITWPTGGTVQAAGVNCGTKGRQCAVTMPAAMRLGLQATADPGNVFVAWAGHCAGSSSSYALSLEGPRTCSATFAPAK